MSRALVFVLVCAAVLALEVAGVSAASIAEDKAAAKKDYGLRSAILKRARRLMKPRSESKQATSVSRQGKCLSAITDIK